MANKSFKVKSVFVDANAGNNYAKCQLYPPYGLEDLSFFSHKILAFGCHDNQSLLEVWTKFIFLLDDHSKNISETFLSK